MKKRQLSLIICIIFLFGLKQKLHAQEEVTCNVSTYAQTIESPFYIGNKWKLKVKCSEEWITVTSGKTCKDCFYISVEENNNDQERRGTVIFKGRKGSKKITIIQEGQDITSKFTCEVFKKDLAIYRIVSSAKKIRVKDVSSVKELKLGKYAHIKSFAGLEYFKELETFYYSSGNSYSSEPELKLDLSHNQKIKKVHCFNAKIKQINVSNCPELEELYCVNTKIDTIDISRNYNLRKLTTKRSCFDYESRSSAESLIIFPEFGCKTPKLEELYCERNNYKSLELYKCPLLKRVDCSQNRQLKNLDLKDCVNLTYLNCHLNQIEYLDLRDCIKLDTLICHKSSIKKIRFGKNASLSYLDCQDNFLFELNTSSLESLRYLNCSNAYIPYLDLTANTNLERLYYTQGLIRGVVYEDGYKMYLKELLLPNNIDTPAGKGLTVLDVQSNNLEKLDLSRVPNLKHLKCSSNRLKELDLTNNRELETVDCSSNFIRKLDFTNCFNLQELICGAHRAYYGVKRREDFWILEYLYLPNQQNTPPGKRLRKLNFEKSNLKHKIDFSSYPELKEIDF
ncbi:BACON domain-containing protein [Bacteroides sp. 224]|uniref:BACON domain-containing protein n=1 Tax=Bacteroides sp. 224 TaxID=2302936 RepID=UPI0013D7F921|nr:BACON domain-containing carbohydrate-binding protein [Bacteroides sp. 224]NDV64581.1 hypothetical protein [Bacteroides sp. 224]